MPTPTAYPVRLWRLIRLFPHFAVGIVKVALVFPRLSATSREAMIRSWSQGLCNILRIRTAVIGTPPVAHAGRVLVVANHISWIDVFVLNGVVASRFVAKSEVRGWPLLGWLCQHSGTLFVHRERRHDTRRVNQEINDALIRHELVSVFPEGGTTDGNDVARFNASLLQPAIDANALIAPVAIRYRDASGNATQAAAYVGEMSLLDSLRLLLAERSLIAEVHYLPAISAQGLQRRDLALTAHHQVRAAVLGTAQPYSQESTRGCKEGT